MSVRMVSRSEPSAAHAVPCTPVAQMRPGPVPAPGLIMRSNCLGLTFKYVRCVLVGAARSNCAQKASC
ncbi:hypothetical protein D3C71_1237700 [compost metagenome]